MSENGPRFSSFTPRFREFSFGTILGGKRYSIWVKLLLRALPLLEQPSLFSDLELRQIRHSGLNASPSLEIGASTLQDWKQRIFQYQQQMMVESVRPAQATLFEGQGLETNLEMLDPFGLRSQNIEFWRWPASEPGLAALYFVIDYELPLVLYVGETCQSKPIALIIYPLPSELAFGPMPQRPPVLVKKWSDRRLRNGDRPSIKKTGDIGEHPLSAVSSNAKSADYRYR
jgi:hypothetical protein